MIQAIIFSTSWMIASTTLSMFFVMPSTSAMMIWSAASRNLSRLSVIHLMQVVITSEMALTVLSMFLRMPSASDMMICPAASRNCGRLVVIVLIKSSRHRVIVWTISGAFCASPWTICVMISIPVLSKVLLYSSTVCTTSGAIWAAIGPSWGRVVRRPSIIFCISWVPILTISGSDWLSRLMIWLTTSNTWLMICGPLVSTLVMI